MCLSTAYKNRQSDNLILMKNVMNISVDGKDIILTDLMENTETIRGRLKKVDMIDNYIIIEVDE